VQVGLIWNPEMRHVQPEDTDPETYQALQEEIAWADRDWERAADLVAQAPRRPIARTDEERAEQVGAITQDILNKPKNGASWKRERALAWGRKIMAKAGQGPGPRMPSVLRTWANAIIRRAGLIPWAKTFVNLRSSRATELIDEFPQASVTAWLGHSASVSVTHYQQVLPEHHARAVAGDQAATRSGGRGGGVAGPAGPDRDAGERPANGANVAA
jgi:hypothetical protein